MCASWSLGLEMHDVGILCQGSSVGQEGICSVLYLLVFRIVHHVYTCITQVAACKQHQSLSNLVQATLGVDSVIFWSFTVAWTRGGGVDT